LQTSRLQTARYVFQTCHVTISTKRVQQLENSSSRYRHLRQPQPRTVIDTYDNCHPGQLPH